MVRIKYKIVKTKEYNNWNYVFQGELVFRVNKENKTFQKTVRFAGINECYDGTRRVHIKLLKAITKEKITGIVIKELFSAVDKLFYSPSILSTEVLSKDVFLFSENKGDFQLILDWVCSKKSHCS